MRVLAIDTSSNVATVAVMEDELLLGEYILNHKKTHSQKIMTMIEQILSELELTVRILTYLRRLSDRVRLQDFV